MEILKSESEWVLPRRSRNTVIQAEAELPNLDLGKTKCASDLE